MLLTHLPPGSRTAAALGTAADEWSRTEQLLAGIFDVLQRLTWVAIAVNSKNEPPRPEPLPRPGMAPAAGRSFHDTIRALAAMPG